MGVLNSLSPQSLQSKGLPLKDILCYTKSVEPCVLLFRVVFKHFLLYANWRIIQHQIKMIGYIKEPHTSIFIGQTGCGKTHLVLELIEKEHSKHFDFFYFNILSLSFVQHSEKIIRPAMLRSGSKTTIIFGL